MPHVVYDYLFSGRDEPVDNSPLINSIFYWVPLPLTILIERRWGAGRLFKESVLAERLLKVQKPHFRRTPPNHEFALT